MGRKLTIRGRKLACGTANAKKIKGKGIKAKGVRMESGEWDRDAGWGHKAIRDPGFEMRDGGKAMREGLGMESREWRVES